MIFIKQIWKCDNECSKKENTIEKLERTIQHHSERRGKKKRSGTSEEVTIDPTWRMEQRVEENIMTNTHSYSCGTLRNTIHKCSYIKQNSQHNNNIQNSESHPQIK